MKPSSRKTAPAPQRPSGRANPLPAPDWGDTTGTGVDVDVGWGIGVAVGSGSPDPGVLVGETGVLVGGTGVSVGGTGVSVGGTGVSVGGTGVSVGGTGVSVGGGDGVGVTPAWTGARPGPATRAPTNSRHTPTLNSNVEGQILESIGNAP